MTKHDDILDAAEHAFERRGFHAVPVDEIIGAAAVSPRTLYRHFPGKTELAVAVLQRRHTRFVEQMQSRGLSIDGLFEALLDWLGNTPASGCLFLRALGEYGDAPVAPVVAHHKTAFRDLLREIASRNGQSDEFADALFLLIEGATALAPKLGAAAATSAARDAARRLAEAPA